MAQEASGARVRLPQPATSADFYLHAIASELRALNDKLDAALAGEPQPASKLAGEMELREPAAPPLDAPWAGYDDATAEEIIARLRGMDADTRNMALAYERANKNRVTITRVNWNS